MLPAGFLFLGVDADHRFTAGLVSLDLGVDVSELGVAIRILLAFQGFRIRKYRGEAHRGVVITDDLTEGHADRHQATTISTLGNLSIERDELTRQCRCMSGLCPCARQSILGK